MLEAVEEGLAEVIIDLHEAARAVQRRRTRRFGCFEHWAPRVQHREVKCIV